MPRPRSGSLRSEHGPDTRTAPAGSNVKGRRRQPTSLWNRARHSHTPKQRAGLPVGKKAILSRLAMLVLLVGVAVIAENWHAHKQLAMSVWMIGMFLLIMSMESRLVCPRCGHRLRS